MFADRGYEPATMSEIAERAGASIGSLYQFFPNKLAVAHALRLRYCSDFEARLEEFACKAQRRDLRAFAAGLAALNMEFVESCPAFLPLLEAPAKFSAMIEPVARLQQQLAHCLRKQAPQLSQPQASRLAEVTLELLKGQLHLYARAQIRERRAIAAEFRIVIESYLASRFAQLES